MTWWIWMLVACVGMAAQLALVLSLCRVAASGEGAPTAASPDRARR